MAELFRWEDPVNCIARLLGLDGRWIMEYRWSTDLQGGMALAQITNGTKRLYGL